MKILRSHSVEHAEKRRLVCIQTVIYLNAAAILIKVKVADRNCVLAQNHFGSAIIKPSCMLNIITDTVELYGRIIGVRGERTRQIPELKVEKSNFYLEGETKVSAVNFSSWKEIDKKGLASSRG